MRHALTLRKVCRAGFAGRGTPSALITGWHSRRLSPTRDKVSGRSGCGFTLLEMTVVVAVVALAAGLLLPRLADLEVVTLDTAARRLVDGIAFGRERAILGGAPMRLVLDLDAGRWVVARPGRGALDVEGEPAPAARPVTLPARIRLRAVTVGGTVAARTGTVALDFAPEGDALPARIELADDRGRAASVIVPPGGGRAVVVREEAG